jgi:tetratricopeptide (TPR) repeat protein
MGKRASLERAASLRARIASLRTLAPLAPVFIVSCLGAGRALADQFVGLDVAITHEMPNPGACKFMRAAKVCEDLPSNWIEPVNYAEGTVHMRLEVMSKPTETPILYQLCVLGPRSAEGWRGQMCSRNQKVTKPGIYEWEQRLSTFHKSHGEIDFSTGIGTFKCAVKDRKNVYIDTKYECAGRWAGSPDFALYYPMEVRFRAVFVSKGATYDPNWEIGGLKHADLVHLKALVPAWKEGRFGQVLDAAEKALKSRLPERAAEAQKVVLAMRSHADAEREGIVKGMQTDAAGAVERLVELGRVFLPSEKGKALVREAEAWRKLSSARELERRKKLTSAAKLYDEIVEEHGEFEPAKLAKKALASLRETDEFREQDRQARLEDAAERREDEAKDRLEAARGLVREMRYAAAHRALKDLIWRYKDTAAAKEAEAELASMESNPDIMSSVRKAKASRSARAWLSMGRNYARMGRKAKAREYFQKVLDEFPDTDHAAEAEKELSKLH